MSDYSASVQSALLANQTNVSSYISKEAQKVKARSIQKALDKRHAEEQRIVDEHNRMSREEQTRVYAQRQAISYRLSVAQMVDAQLQAREFELQSQDYLAAAQVRRSEMGSRYSRSGALLAGSALARTDANEKRARQGAARLQKAAKNARERGRMLSTITKHSASKPMFVPLPDAIKQEYVPPYVPPKTKHWSNLGDTTETNAWGRGNRLAAMGLGSPVQIQSVGAFQGGSYDIGTASPTRVAERLGGAYTAGAERGGSSAYAGGHISGTFDFSAQSPGRTSFEYS